jgi:hypothetical protein
MAVPNCGAQGAPTADVVGPLLAARFVNYEALPCTALPVLVLIAPVDFFTEAEERRN